MKASFILYNDFEEPPVSFDLIIRLMNAENIDPENPLCQVLGKFKLRLDDRPGTRPRFNQMEVYECFGENCPSQAPEYAHQEEC